MTNKKNKFLTFCISLIPGAGEMYLGFYKTGVGIMVLFWGIMAFSEFLFPPSFYLLPILWFYSFFHTNNLNHMPEDEFYALEDDYLFHIQPNELADLAKRYRKPLAFVLILIGISIIWSNLQGVFIPIAHWFIWSEALWSMFSYWNDAVPRFAAAALIIWIGWRLIHDKKETLNTPPYLADKEVKDFKKKET